MDELVARLRVMRSEIVETMAGALTVEENWQCWLPLLAQVETAIQAVEAIESDAADGRVQKELEDDEQDCGRDLQA